MKLAHLFGFALVALSLGLPAAQAAEDKRFGDWVLHCADVSGGEKACALHQKIISEDTRLTVASFSVARNKHSKDLRVAVMLPLGLDIPAGVSGKAGDVALPFIVQTCVRRGCIASTTVDEKLLSAMHGAQSFATTFKMRSVAEPTTLTVSLKGFHEALTALDSH